MQHTKIAVAVKAALMLTLTSAPGWAQDAESEDSPKIEESRVKKDNEQKSMETVEVVGIRGALQDNLNNKRFSNAIKDALNTEDVDKNPDKNLAEALQRVSGVQITRDFGEGATISIRGTDVNFTNTLLNGQNMKSAQSLPLRGEMNAFDFSSVAAEQVSQIEVYKSPQADLDAGGIGGTVILKTKKPLDREANSGYLKVEDTYNDGSGKNSPQLGALYSWKTEDDTFGASANLSYQELNLQRDGNEAILGWYDYYLDGVPSQVVNSIDDVNLYNVRTLDTYERSGAMWGIPGSARFERDRKRLGGTVSFQYRATDNLDLNLEYTRNHTDDPNTSRNLFSRAYRLARSAYSTGEAESESGYEVDRVGDMLLHAEQDIYDVQHVNNDGVRYWGTPANLINMEFQDRDGSEKTSDMLNLTSTWDSDHLNVKVQAGRSTGKSHVEDFATQFWLNIDHVDDNPDLPVIDNGLADVSIYYDYDPEVNFAGWGMSDEEWLKNPTTEMLMHTLFKRVQDRENNENFLQADTLWTLEENTWFVDSIKFGAKYRDLSSDNQRFLSDSVRADGVEILAGDLAGGVVSGIREDIGRMPTAYFDVDRGKRDALWNDDLLLVDDLDACDDLIGMDGGSYKGCRSEYVEEISQFYDQNQDIAAFYTMVNFSGQRFRGNIGVRVVDTERESLTLQAEGEEIRDVITTSSTTDVLPSMNLSVDLTDELLLRTAASKVISHPLLFQIRDGFSIDGNFNSAGELLGEGDQRRGFRGNPDLKSYEAKQFELGAEWYFTESSLFGVTAFYKDITNMIRSQVAVQDLTGAGTDTSGQPLEGDYAITSYYNAGEQAINGYEVQFQHDFNNGFGVLANYTFVNIPMEEFTTQNIEAEYLEDENGIVVSDDDLATITGFQASDPEIDEVRTPGNSKDTANLSAYYEDDRFSARLSYNYRSMYFASVDSQASRVRDDRSQVDMKLTYSLTDNLTAGLSVYNLTNENNDYFLIRDQLEAPEGGIPEGMEPYYTQRVSKVAHNSYESGRRYFASLNWRF